MFWAVSSASVPSAVRGLEAARTIQLRSCLRTSELLPRNVDRGQEPPGPSPLDRRGSRKTSSISGSDVDCATRETRIYIAPTATVERREMDDSCVGLHLLKWMRSLNRIYALEEILNTMFRPFLKTIFNLSVDKSRKFYNCAGAGFTLIGYETLSN